MKKSYLKYYSIIGLLCLFNVFTFQIGNLIQNKNLNRYAIIASDVGIISDGFNGSYWDDGNSQEPSITVDDFGNMHVVWSDWTSGIWGGGLPDTEIMYAFYIDGIGWSNATVISDGYNEYYWNNNYSNNPSIAVDTLGNVHVVWTDTTSGIWGDDSEIMYVNYTIGVRWSNVTIISDGYNNFFWNDGNSVNPSITIDNLGNIHVVWSDWTSGIWGTDNEIMYVNYTIGVGWSNVTIISDGYNNFFWNDDNSQDPSITVDTSGNIHVVWSDWTSGIWGTDNEIMYVNYTIGVGWSNVTVPSDGFNNYYWNNGSSAEPSITVDIFGNVHVVWNDDTFGIWGGGLLDLEIMYASYIEGIGWSNATVLSDGYNGSYWNDGTSLGPSITVDTSGIVYVIWSEGTDGIWGTDSEIMYVNYTIGVGWSNVTEISDDESRWNDGDSTNPYIAADTSGNIYMVWEDHTFGIWGFDQEIMNIYFSYSIIEEPPLIDSIFITIVFSILILISIAFLLFLERDSKRKIKNYLKKKILIDICNFSLNVSLISVQIYQIDNNTKRGIKEIADDPFIFLLPYFLLILAIIILLLISLSLVISLKEYKSYLKTTNKELVVHRKLKFEKIFENKNRQKIIQTILENPGIHFQELLRECFLQSGQLRWHLRVLIEFRIIRKKPIGQYNSYFSRIDNIESNNYSKILMKSKLRIEILELIEKNPGIIPSTIANNLDLKMTTLNYHINKLKNNNLIKTHKEGRNLRLYSVEDEIVI